MDKARIVIVTGMSGSGKSTAIKALEDCGFFCIDNLPIVILDKLLMLVDQHPQVGRLALGIDARERAFLGAFGDVVEGVRKLGHSIDVLFLDASDEVLIRRFSETRRRHPLEAESCSVAEGIAKERVVLAPLRDRSTWTIDTSRLNVHQLKRLIQQAYDPSRARMSLHLVSFGFRHGIPREADYVFDCRLLPNPYFVDELRPKAGTDKEVREYLEARPEWNELCSKITDFLAFVIPLHENEGKPLLTVAFGCTGGRHRSVAVAEEVATRLAKKGLAAQVEHRHVSIGL